MTKETYKLKLMDILIIDGKEYIKIEALKEMGIELNLNKE